MTKRQEIIRYLATVESASIDEIYSNVSFSYYHNASKHLGAILSAMVKANEISRIKKGVFSIKLGNSFPVYNGESEKTGSAANLRNSYLGELNSRKNGKNNRTPFFTFKEDPL